MKPSKIIFHLSFKQSLALYTYISRPSHYHINNTNIIMHNRHAKMLLNVESIILVPNISLSCQATVVDRFYLCMFMTGFSLIDDMSSYQDKIL
jgi:hypothetical protein